MIAGEDENGCLEIQYETVNCGQRPDPVMQVLLLMHCTQSKLAVSTGEIHRVGNPWSHNMRVRNEKNCCAKMTKIGSCKQNASVDLTGSFQNTRPKN